MLNVMIVGDSISHGSSGDWTWRYRLWKHLRAHGVELDLVGPANDLDNATTAEVGDGDLTYCDPAFDQDHCARWGRPYLEEMHQIEDKVRAHRPDVLLVLLGINDLFWYGLGPEENEANVRAFVAAARRGNPALRLVLGTLLDTQRAREDVEFNARVSEFNRRLVLLAEELHTDASPIVIAPTGAEFVAAAHTWDGTHPNAQGELRIAAAFADTLAGRFAVGVPYPRPFPVVEEIPAEAKRVVPRPERT
ncbi:GDSL-type esterase/lipase family protein [Actinomadura hibisca]|uniref:GDSL-type esterase/lipase family protein n=1 Tax=Actinomadura hibisca TaxID=68565 RepID=UPI00082A1BFD|nr:GDSL-type esterase/lipase family protein [Actinomadura hibisca]